LSEEGHLLIEAGTGVGKSLGYLVPAVRWALASGQPVVVSTNPKILQDQLLTSDYPRLVRLLERELPAPVVLKGRENYLCLEKLRLHALTTRSELRELLQELEGLGQVRAGALALIALALHMVNVPAGDFDFIRLPDTLSAENSRRLKQKLSAAFRGCLRERCPLLKHCYFYAQREAAEHSPVTIVNHALLFALAHSENEATPDLLASFVDQAPVWVLDEAHNLEEVLLDALGVSINSYDLIEFVNGVSRLLQDRRLATRLTLPVDEVPAEHQEVFFSLRNLQAQVPGAAEAVFACFRNLSEVVSGAYARLREESAGELLRLDLTEPQKEEAASVRDALLDGVAALHDHLLDLNDGLLLLAEQTGGKPDGFFYLDDNRYQMRLREVLSIFAGLKQGCAGFLAEAETWVRWLEALPAGRRKDLMWELAACPVVVGEHFVNLVRSRKSVLMVSGTLAIHRSFEYVKRCLGLHLLPQESLREVVLASPFDYSRRALVLIPHDVPEPDFRDRKAHQRYLEALSEVVAEAAGVFGGAALVLFNSYADLQAVVKLSGELEQAGFTLLVQERGISRIQLAGRFRETEKAVLFGTRSFWEGFDIPGEDLQCVIISRLPFPNLNDPITAGKMRYIDRNGGNSFTEFMLPSAIMKFTQGFGRLIRSTQDYGCVLLLDRRVLTKNYGAEFLRNLPGPWIVRSPRNRLNNLMSQFLARVRSQA